MMRPYAGLMCLMMWLSLPAAAQQLDTANTQRNDMHSCPTTSQGFLTYTAGYDASTNRMLCQSSLPYTPAKVPSNEHVDGRSPNPPTQEQGMHACPGSQVVTGVRVDRNELTCVDLSIPTYNTAQERLEPEDQYQCHLEIRSTPFPHPVLVCGNVRQPSNMINGVHSCHSDEALHGINIGDDRLLCVKFFGVL